MNIDILRARLDELETDLRTLHTSAGDRALNRAEQSRWDELEAERAEVRDALREAEATDAKLSRLAAPRAKWGSLSVGSTTGGAGAVSHTPTEVARMGDAEARSAARRILDDQRAASRHLDAGQGDHVDELLRSTDRRNTDGGWIAKAMLLTETPEYRSAFQRVMTDRHPVLTAGEAEALRAFQEFRAMSIGTDAAGGYGVPVLIDPTIILTGQQSGNPFWNIARVETITTDAWKGVSSAGVTWSWDAEGAEVSDDTPTLAQPTVPVHTARGFVPFSIEVGQDYPNFAAETATLLAEGYSELTAAAFATGTGSGEPLGIVTALDANTNVEVVVTTDGTFSATDVDKVWTALPDRAKANATWLMSTDVESYIAGWGDAYGGRTTDLASRLSTLRGRPHVTSDYMPDFTGTTGAANILVVGDFRRFVIAQRAGMSVELVPHLLGTTNGRPTGQRGWFAWARVGSGTSDDTAFRLLQNQ